MNADEERRAKEMASMQASQESKLQKMQEQERQREEMEERKRVIIRQILEPEAWARLSRVGLVRPDKQQQIEGLLLAQVQSGRIAEKISEGTLIAMIEQIDAATKPTTSIKIQRKRRDDDFDIDLDNL